MAAPKISVDMSVETNREIAGRLGVAWREIRRGAANNALRHLIFESEEFAIEPGQMDTLEKLVMHESMRMGELADAMKVDPSTATRAVQKLIKDGLAERVAHDGDARVVVVGPTERGRAVFLQVVERRRRLVLLVLEQFAEDEREKVAEILERFSAAVDSAVNELSQQQH
ncbi:MAG: MarR family winged helix-turn-helix transcriptional regulator [Ilumatobacteraceae bacterium]